MDEQLFEKLMESANQAAQYAQGDTQVIQLPRHYHFKSKDMKESHLTRRIS